MTTKDGRKQYYWLMARDEDRKTAEKKATTQKARGSFTNDQASPIGGVAQGAPDFFQSSAQMTEEILGDQFNVAEANLQSKEKLRESQLENQGWCTG